MATFTSDVQLAIRAGSSVSQVEANRALRDLLRDAIRAAAVLGIYGSDAPSAGQIDAMSTSECRPWAQKIARHFIRGLAREQRLRAVEEASVRPVREAPDETEDAP